MAEDRAKTAWRNWMEASVRCEMNKGADRSRDHSLTEMRDMASPAASVPPEPPTLSPARDGETLSDEPERDNSIGWLRWWSSPGRWKTLGPEHDYKIFGSLRLSDIRNAIAQHERTDRALVDASAELAFQQELAEARGATLAALRAELADARADLRRIRNYAEGNDLPALRNILRVAARAASGEDASNDEDAK